MIYSGESDRERRSRELRGPQDPGDHPPPGGTEGAGGASELLELRARVRELTTELHAALHFLGSIREHAESVFSSHRWRIGSRIVDAYLRLRGRQRPDTAEDHLRRLYRDVDAWQTRRRSFGNREPGEQTAPSPATGLPRARSEAERRGLLFFQQVGRVLGATETGSLSQLFERSEEMILAHQAATASYGGPLVSVVLPTYNRAHVLDEAVRSVFEQTYTEWELIVSDDGSSDSTAELVAEFDDSRIRYLRGENAGAAVARNRALREARGEIIAYLDSDNIWHPDHLLAMVGGLERHPGHYCVFAKHIDVVMEADCYRVKGYHAPPFSYERLAQKNFIDLNVFAHRRELFDVLGGFDDALRRQQDWDLILKYAFLRDPLFLDMFLVLYRRNPSWDQITVRERENLDTVRVISDRQERFHTGGPTVLLSTPRPSVSVISWDICRNHLSKAYNLAEALSQDRDVELVGFRFFEEEIFPPYAHETPSFETKYFTGRDFPSFHHDLARALAAIRGDVVYAVKPRLPSLGLALLANFHFGKPVVLEINDLESEVSNPRPGEEGPSISLARTEIGDRRLLVPHHELWSRLLEGLAPELPTLVTHNANLDRRFGEKSYQVRNLKDERWYEPASYTREEIRQRLGFAPADRVLLFGGMVRRHKGVFSLAEFVEALDDQRYKLLVVSSRASPDAAELERSAGERVRILPPQGRNQMAEINSAADATVLWLDPSVPASHFQMPYKLTDALAMQLPVVANPVSDLTALGQAGALRLVEFGDYDQLARSLEEIFSDTEATSEMTRRGRRLYLRQFGYRAARANVELLLRRGGADRRCLRAASSFESFFADFYLATAPRMPEDGR